MRMHPVCCRCLIVTMVSIRFFVSWEIFWPWGCIRYAAVAWSWQWSASDFLCHEKYFEKKISASVYAMLQCILHSTPVIDPRMYTKATCTHTLLYWQNRLVLKEVVVLLHRNSTGNVARGVVMADYIPLRWGRGRWTIIRTTS